MTAGRNVTSQVKSPALTMEELASHSLSFGTATLVAQFGTRRWPEALPLLAIGAAMATEDLLAVAQSAGPRMEAR